uniref:LamG-like jellyroll fold domain-containing protein n=1 Tax=viral metagenome TaxID=1070528 RepID=A0A6C0DRQ8_9ZZZZ
MNLPPTQADTGISNIVQKSIQNVGNAVASIRDNVSTAVTGFNQPAAPTEFNYSNTIIAKFAFLILVVIVFLFFLNLGINLIGYFTSFSTNPYLVSGMLDGNVSAVIPQDPKNSDSVYLQRSNNQATGAEFTWSIWLFINDFPKDQSYHHIFNKGDINFDSNELALNNSPGLYYGGPNNGTNAIHHGVDPITEDTNVLTVLLDVTDSQQPVNIPIDNIPIQKWVNVIIRLENTILDVYVNGTIAGRTVLQSVPNQNYYPVNVGQNGGFPGTLSDLRYFARALNVFDIQSIVSKGPSTKTSKLSSNVKSADIYNYLSNMWYTHRL